MDGILTFGGRWVNVMLLARGILQLIATASSWRWSLSADIVVMNSDIRATCQQIRTKTVYRYIRTCNEYEYAISFSS